MHEHAWHGEQVLLTGGAGFIGSHFCRRFEELGVRYSILDLHRPGSHTRPVLAVQGDVRDADAVRRAMAGCTAVLHLAAAHHDSGIDDETYHSVNRDGTGTVLDVARAAGVRRFCFYSSAAVYGRAETQRDESSEPNPTSPYGRSKLAAEQLIQQRERGSDQPVLIVRPTVTFGPNNFANMYSLIRQIDSGRFVQIGRGENIKSLSYVENLVDFTLWMWPRVPQGVAVYNWVEYPDRSSAEIVRTLASLLGKRLPRFALPLPIAEVIAAATAFTFRVAGRDSAITPMRVRKLALEQTFFSAARAREAGYTPLVSLDEGMARTVRWYREHGHREPTIRRLPPRVVQRFVEQVT
jgi:nucleoside-diphosphate-sugar epimerase